MKKNLFYKVVFGMALAAALVFASCGEEAGVDFPALDAPDVAPTAIEGGVKLEWKAVIGADGYEIFRREGSGVDTLVSSPYAPSSPIIDPATGKYVWRDLESSSVTSVKANTTYTYTVVAKSDDAKKEAAKAVTVTTSETFLAKGADLAAPASVALVLDDKLQKITVTVTPGTNGDVVNSYSVQVKRSGSTVGNGTITYPATTTQIDWQDYQQQDGAYTAVVSTNASSYYKTGTAVKASEAVPFTSLFGTSFSLLPSVSGSGSIITETGSSAISKYSATLSPSGLKPGIAYSFERAPADKATGKAAGAYDAVTLSVYKGSAYVAATAADLTTDLINGVLDTLFDQTLPKEGGSFIYRVTATKDGKTASKESDVLTIDPKEVAPYIVSAISVAAKNTDTANVAKYSVTPGGVYCTGVLPADSKLVIYWLKSNSSYDYQYGKYLDKIEFSKAELEAATVEPKSIDVPAPAGEAGTYYVFAQAYLEFADGTRENLQSAWNSSPGITNPNGSYFDSVQQKTIYYAQFNY